MGVECLCSACPFLEARGLVKKRNCCEATRCPSGQGDGAGGCSLALLPPCLEQGQSKVLVSLPDKPGYGRGSVVWHMQVSPPFQSLVAFKVSVTYRGKTKSPPVSWSRVTNFHWLSFPSGC